MISNLIVVVAIIVAMSGSYLWGYRNGVRYCMRQIAPLHDVAKKMVSEINESRRSRRDPDRRA